MQPSSKSAIWLDQIYELLSSNEAANDYDTLFALQNIANANSFEDNVVFTLSVKRVMNADPNLIALKITNQCMKDFEIMMYHEHPVSDTNYDMLDLNSSKGHCEKIVNNSTDH